MNDFHKHNADEGNQTRKNAFLQSSKPGELNLWPQKLGIGYLSKRSR